jgi:hypothetical protein
MNNVNGELIGTHRWSNEWDYIQFHWVTTMQWHTRFRALYCVVHTGQQFSACASSCCLSCLLWRLAILPQRGQEINNSDQTARRRDNSKCADLLIHYLVIDRRRLAITVWQQFERSVLDPLFWGNGVTPWDREWSARPPARPSDDK